MIFIFIDLFVGNFLRVGEGECCRRNVAGLDLEEAVEVMCSEQMHLLMDGMPKSGGWAGEGWRGRLFISGLSK
jgi:hypothetical protein